MKAAVYLADTGELLGVVNVPSEQAHRLKHGGAWRCADYGRMHTRGPIASMEAMDAVYREIEIKAVPIYTGKGSTFFLVVQEREHMALWHKQVGRQVFPRFRDRENKMPKGFRRDRAAAGFGGPRGNGVFPRGSSR